MTRRVLVATASGVLGLGLLAGCGAGQTAATAQNLPSVPGVNVTEAGIAVRNAAVVFDPAGYPAGGDAPIQLSIFNQTTEPVRLLEASTPAGASVMVTSAVAVGEPVEPELPGPGGQGDTDNAAEVSLAPGAFVTATLQVIGLTEAVNGTTTLPVELTFDNDVVMLLTVPVATPLEPLQRPEPISGVYHH